MLANTFFKPRFKSDQIIIQVNKQYSMRNVDIVKI